MRTSDIYSGWHAAVTMSSPTRKKGADPRIRDPFSIIDLQDQSRHGLTSPVWIQLWTTLVAVTTVDSLKQ
jgi:hypothetical protein